MSARASDVAIDERSSTLALVGAGGGAPKPPKAPKAPKPAAPPKPPAAAKKGKGKKKEKVDIAMEPALPLAELLGSTNFPQTEGEYYVTTAINYANGAPHMGHAYEGITSDVVARYHKAYGREVFFLTGADEHGQKIADTAAAAGVEPIALVDKHVAQFQELNKKLAVENTRCVRRRAIFGRNSGGRNHSRSSR